MKELINKIQVGESLRETLFWFLLMKQYWLFLWIDFQTLSVRMKDPGVALKEISAQLGIEMTRN